MDGTRGSEGTNDRWTGLGATVVCAVAGAALFQFYGNATRGYIDTPSLFAWWIRQWLDPAADAQHGWFLLGLSGWLFVRGVKRETRDERRVTSCAAAAAAFAAALFLHAVGFAVQQTRISIVALLVFLWGLAVLFGGRRMGRAAVFPLVMLVFAIPMNLLDSVGFWLRMGVLEISTAIARLAGIEVLESGTQLVAPDGRYQYDVAAACSGIRSLTAMAALSLLIGYLNFRSRKLWILLFVACIPLVLLGNVARICAIIFAAHWGGEVWGDRAHAVMGFGVFAIVLGGLMGIAALLRKGGAACLPAEALAKGSPQGAAGDVAQENDDPGVEPATPHSTPKPARWGQRAPPIVACGVVLAVAVEMAALSTLASRPAREGAGVILSSDGLNPVDLPAFLPGDWIGRPSAVTAIEREVLPPDTGYSRRQYVPLASPEKAVLLSIVLSGRDRTSIHRPELCLVGQGWTIQSTAAHRFTHPADPLGAFPARILSVQQEVMTPKGPVVVPQLVAYWFVSSDGVAASHWERIARDAWGRLTRLRSQRWAYVLMQTTAADGEPAALARMQEVLDRTLPAFQPPIAAR